MMQFLAHLFVIVTRKNESAKTLDRTVLKEMLECARINKNKIELEELRTELIDPSSLLTYSKYFLMNLSELWLNSAVEDKIKLQELIFPDKIYIENNKLRTDQINNVLRLINSENSSIFNEKSDLVSLGRFELPTPGLGILCSIHLSYRDTQ